VCGHPVVASILAQSGIRCLADSRISNIRKMRQAGVNAQFMLLRTPALSQVEEVIKHVDISLNTELAAIHALSERAVQSGKRHPIILMVELGDLREGILPSDLEDVVSKVLGYKGVRLAGIGANLACFGGVNPDENKMRLLCSLVEKVEKRFALTLEIVSGGNSANYNWFVSTKDVGRINNLRLGESLFLGRETLYRNPISGLCTDAFTLVAEVIESKIKPSVPEGDLCQDAFGHIPSFKDRGMIRRVILNIGLQDVQVSGLTPRIDMEMDNRSRNHNHNRNLNHVSGLTPPMDVEILGANSDLMILDAKERNLKLGDEVAFDLSYKALSTAMASPYVEKILKPGERSQDASPEPFFEENRCGDTESVL